MIENMLNKYITLPIQAKASFWFLLCLFLQKSISVLTTPVFTRLLTTAEFGQYNVFTSWLGITSAIVSLNLSFGVYSQGLIKFDKEKDKYTSSLTGLTTVLMLGWTIIYLSFSSYWNRLFSLTTIQMLSMLVIIWTSAIFNFWATYQRAEYKYVGLLVLTIIVSVAKPILGIVLIYHADDKVTARILGVLIVEVVCYAWLFIIQQYKGKRFYDGRFWKYAILFNLPLLPHYLSHTILNSADRIMIGRMTSVSETGIYSLAYSIALVMTLFNTAIMQTINPWLYQKIKDKEYNSISNIGYISLIVISVANLLLIAFAPEIVAVFAPIEYYEAVWAIPPVAMSVFFMFAYDLFAKFAFYYEKTVFIMLASVIGAMLNIILNYCLIKEFGYIAAAYTTLLCYFVFTLFHYVFMNKVCDDYCNSARPYSSKKLSIILVCFIMLSFSIMLTYHNLIIRYLGIIFFVFITYLHRERIRNFYWQFISIKKSSGC